MFNGKDHKIDPLPTSPVTQVQSVVRPPFTISYEVTHDGPPDVPKEVYLDPQFWDTIFEIPVFKALLNAVVSLAPVEARTISDWQNMGLFKEVDKKVEGGTLITMDITYVLSDFIIEVDKDMHVSVKYTRLSHYETTTELQIKQSQWGVIMAVVGMVLTVATAGAATPLALTVASVASKMASFILKQNMQSKTEATAKAMVSAQSDYVIETPAKAYLQSIKSTDTFPGYLGPPALLSEPPSSPWLLYALGALTLILLFGGKK